MDEVSQKIEVNEAKLITMLTLIQITHVLDFVMMMPLGPQLIRDLELSSQQFSLIVSSYTFVAAIMGFLSSRVMDKFDRKSILKICYFIFSITTLLCGFSESYMQLLLARSLAGASGGLITGIVLAIIADIIPEYRRGAAFGKVMTAFPVSSVLGIPAGLYIAQKFSWQTPFLILGVLSFLIFWTLNYTIPSCMPGTIHKSENVDVLQSISKSNIGLALAGTLFITAATFLIVPYISISFVSQAHVREDQIFIVFAAGGSLTFFTSKMFGKMTDKYGKLKIFLVLIFISSFAAIGITNLPEKGLWAAIPITVAFMVLNSGRFVAFTALIFSRIPDKIRGQFSTINSSVQSMAAGLGALLAGQIVFIDEQNNLHNFSYNGMIAIVLLVFCVMSVVAFKKRTEPLASVKKRS